MGDKLFNLRQHHLLTTFLLPLKNIEVGNNQNLKFFKRGRAISGIPRCKGINHFPKPPINTGITKKKIIIKPWAVIKQLKTWPSFKRDPGCPNSNRIKNDNDVPTTPNQIPEKKYNIPISL